MHTSRESSLGSSVVKEEAVSLPEVLELLADEVSKDRPHHTPFHRTLEQSSQEQVHVQYRPVVTVTNCSRQFYTNK